MVIELKSKLNLFTFFGMNWEGRFLHKNCFSHVNDKPPLNSVVPFWHKQFTNEFRIAINGKSGLKIEDIQRFLTVGHF